MSVTTNFEAIKSNANVRAIILQVLGADFDTTNKELRTNCPFETHVQKKGFSINTLTGEWFCHSCGKGGDIIKLVKKWNIELTHKEAADFIQEQSGQHVNIAQAIIQAPSYTPQQVLDCWANASLKGNDTYFIHRKLTPPSSARFGKNPKGFSSTLMPFQDIQGAFKGFVCLDANNKRKYNYIIDDSVKFMLLGELKNDGYLFVGEGIATVQTVWEAFDRNIAGVAVGGFRNMIPVLNKLTETYPNYKLIILFDTDKSDKIDEIRKLHPSAICLIPKFQSNNMDLKDYNDIISKENLSLTDVRTQIENGMSQIQNSTVQQATPIDNDVDFLKIDQDTVVQTTTLTNGSNLLFNSIQTCDELIDDQDARRLEYQGKEFIGLPQKTLPMLDELLSGLRKFMVLAAAPNVGKTALSIQIMIDTIINNSGTCAVFVSLEMSRNDIMDRIRCYLTKMTYRKLLFGTSNNIGDGFYTLTEQNQLKESKELLKLIGQNILILDEKCCKEISATTILEKLSLLKKKSNSSKAIVVVDYLQVFPIPDNETSKLRNDNDIDRHRIIQIQKLRDNLENDPLIVIAEARKPSGSEKNWGVSIADILGSSRIAYACDAGVLLNAISDDELGKEISGDKEDGPIFRKELSNKGLSILRLTIDKARDGMQRGNILLLFHFLENTFEEATWTAIKALINIKIQVTVPLTDKKNKQKKQLGASW